MIYSKYVRDLLINAAFRGGSINFPNTYYLGLLVEAPNISNDSYKEIGNVIPNGYARVAVARNSTNWAANGISDAKTSNLSAILFPNPTGDWKHGNVTGATPITHIGFFDSPDIGTGNLWFYIDLGTKKTVEAGHFDITIPVGGLVVQLDK